MKRQILKDFNYAKILSDKILSKRTYVHCWPDCKCCCLLSLLNSRPAQIFLDKNAAKKKDHAISNRQTNTCFLNFFKIHTKHEWLFNFITNCCTCDFFTCTLIFRKGLRGSLRYALFVSKFVVSKCAVVKTNSKSYYLRIFSHYENRNNQ